jgi:hypothetical protein
VILTTIEMIAASSEGVQVLDAIKGRAAIAGGKGPDNKEMIGEAGAPSAQAKLRSASGPAGKANASGH